MDKVIIDRGIAKIGNAIIYGNILYHNNEVKFTGTKIQLKKPLKDPVHTLLKRLAKNCKCSIKAVRSNISWNSKDHELIYYGTTISDSRNGIHFTLREKKWKYVPYVKKKS